MEKSRTRKKLNHVGTTMVEMIVTFALLSLFMVSAARVIAYTVNIYYAAKGASYGLETSTLLSNKIIGMVEGAQGDLEIKKNFTAVSDSLRFTDGTDSIVTIYSKPERTVEGNPADSYLYIHYDEAESGSVKYEETDFKYDRNAYLGYELVGLRFMRPTPEEEYPENVLKMEMELHSAKYGDYNATYYMKAVNVGKITIE